MVTISMYALFYFSAMVGMFLYARVRLGLVRPLEPVSPSHSRRLYVIALVVGTIGIVVFERYGLDPDNQVPDNVRSAGLAFSGLLLFATVSYTHLNRGAPPDYCGGAHVEMGCKVTAECRPGARFRNWGAAD